jgi:ABC-type multidrug transport system ATPase subunit
MPQEKEPIIRVCGISKRLKDIQAVDRVSFDVFDGDVYGFLGPNGSGKSTTIRMLLSLVRADEGAIEIFGYPLKQHYKKILYRIGALVEEPHFYEYLSAHKNLELLSFYTGNPASPERIVEVLELVGLTQRAQSKVKTYSKGMKQRLGIAQALIHDPELLILDEPGIGLDPAGVKDIRELIKYLNAELKKTIFLSSHQLNEIEQLSTRMIIINNGRKVVEGSAEALLQKHHFHTRFQVDDPQRAIRYLGESNFDISAAELEGSALNIFCKRELVPLINKYLNENGIMVNTIVQQQGLEDRIELYKIFARRRSYIAFLAICIIVMIVLMAALYEGQDMLDYLTRNLKQSFVFQGNLVNGYMVSYLVLNFLWVHVPLLIVIVTGDLLAGEANAGTFRILLSRPVSRFSLVTAKYIAALVYTLVIVIFLAILSIGLGLLIFGQGDLMVFLGGVTIFEKSDILWRFAAAYGLGFLSMTTIAALSLLFSSLSNNSLGPILTTMAILITFTMISTLDLVVFRAIKPFLLTTYLDTWQLFFYFDINFNEIISAAGIMLFHILIFYSVTVFGFNRKDILS